MPDYLAPGVYVEELPFAAHSIEGVSTSTAGFIGLLERGSALVTLTSFADFGRSAGPNPSEYLVLAVRGFFENGGQRCYISGLGSGDPLEAGLDALATENVSILCCPDEQNFPNVAQVLAAHCEKRKDRMCILQSTQPVVPDSPHQVPVHSSYATYYYPWLTVTGLDGVTEVTIPPGGHIAGVYARTDTTAGIWKTPAGVPILGVKCVRSKSEHCRFSSATILNRARSAAPAQETNDSDFPQ
jgi:phage tail sheath protein FI